MEEAKTQENGKLHSTIQEMQLEFNKTKETLINERNSAQKETTEVTVIKEVSIIDNTLVEKLSSENDHLKVHVPTIFLLTFNSMLFYLLICSWYDWLYVFMLVYFSLW